MRLHATRERRVAVFAQEDTTIGLDSLSIEFEDRAFDLQISCP